MHTKAAPNKNLKKDTVDEESEQARHKAKKKSSHLVLNEICSFNISIPVEITIGVADKKKRRKK